MNELIVVDHPLVQHKLSLMRQTGTDSALFRKLLEEIALLLTYELSRELPLEPVRIRTPVAETDAPMLAGRPPAVISILRAGNGLLGGVLQLIPTASVGHVGLYRDHDTLEAHQYYFKVPAHLGDRPVLVLDPMLATGNSAAAAVDLLKQAGATDIRFLCLLAAPEGIAAFHARHPEIPIVTASVDSHLNEQGYIVPGLGDAGDRMFGTK